MAKKIRSEYVRNMLVDKDKLTEQFSMLTKETIQNILTEKVDDNIKKLLKEDEDEYKEEEAEDSPLAGKSDDVAPEDDTETADKGEDGAAADVTVDAEDTGAEESGEGTEDVTEPTDNDEWGDLDGYKDVDGEYDLRGMDKEEVVKVLKVMTPEDGVRVVKKDDGTIDLKDDSTNKEYIIDVDGTTGSEGAAQVSDETLPAEGAEDDSFDISFDDDEDNGLGESKVNEENLGYTDNYQSQTAMTTPDNHEPADPKSTYSMDGGVPTGTEKPFANQGDKAPFDKKVSEGCAEGACGEGEQEVNETMTTQENGAYNRGDGMVHTNTNDKAAKGRNAHAGGKQIHGTADNSYSPAQLESIKRKANEIFRENRELKAVLPMIQQRLNEAIVINQSLSNVVKILNENSTTQEEKASMIKRFSDVKTREESNKLYHQISEELHRSNASKRDVNEVINAQISEAKENGSNINESKKPMYEKSEDLKATINLMHRLNGIK